jgi:protein-tyrosine phosphatase
MPEALNIQLITIGAGAVAITHRPKVKLLPTMRSAGVTHLVTLLSKREGALVMGSAARAAGLEWIWVDLANGQQPSPPRHHEIVTALTTLVTLVRNGSKVVIHCSAGIHRTGMFTYALLRAYGLDTDEAISTMTRLRTATAEGVGEQRLTWAEDLAAAARHRLRSPNKMII